MPSQKPLNESHRAQRANQNANAVSLARNRFETRFNHVEREDTMRNTFLLLLIALLTVTRAEKSLGTSRPQYSCC